MKPTEIKLLLQKYFNAETSIEEERLIRRYFQEQVADNELIVYKEFFVNLGNEDTDSEAESCDFIMDHIHEKEAAGKKRIRQLWLTVTGIAASLLIVVGGVLFYQQQQQPAFRDTFSDPEHALAYAEQTLLFVSEQYNRGVQHLNTFHVLNDAVQPLEKSLNTLNKGWAAVTGGLGHD